MAHPTAWEEREAQGVAMDEAKSRNWTREGFDQETGFEMYLHERHTDQYFSLRRQLIKAQ